MLAAEQPRLKSGGEKSSKRERERRGRREREEGEERAGSVLLGPMGSGGDRFHEVRR